MSCPEIVFYEISEHFRERVRMSEEKLLCLRADLQAASDHYEFLELLAAPALMDRMRHWFWKRKFMRAGEKVRVCRNELTRLRLLQAEFQRGQYTNVAEYFADQADSINTVLIYESMTGRLPFGVEGSVLDERASKFYEFIRWLKPQTRTAA